MRVDNSLAIVAYQPLDMQVIATQHINQGSQVLLRAFEKLKTFNQNLVSFTSQETGNLSGRQVVIIKDSAQRVKQLKEIRDNLTKLHEKFSQEIKDFEGLSKGLDEKIQAFQQLHLHTSQLCQKLLSMHETTHKIDLIAKNIFSQGKEATFPTGPFFTIGRKF